LDDKIDNFAFLVVGHFESLDLFIVLFVLLKNIWHLIHTYLVNLQSKLKTKLSRSLIGVQKLKLQSVQKL